ncbi:MAG: fibronectin type III domain-containing protein [Candidatus Paceibacterota bacterium]
MNKIFKKLIYLTIITAIFASFCGQANAEVPTVQFETAPLFGEASFAPGASVSRFVILNNKTSVPHSVITRALNVVNDDGLGDVVHIKIKQGENILYNDTFSNFFNKSEVILSQVPAGESTTFDFVATFDNESGNEYQNKSMSFNLQVGFEGDETTTDETTSISGSSHGSRGGGSTIILIVFNEQALNLTNVEGTGSATITWNTNKLATSQVVYGPMPGPYNLDLNATNFGYPFSNIEDPGKVMNHEMVLTGLTPGVTYLYRVVSRASPPTVSVEHQFTMPLLAQAGLVLGASTENNNGSGLGNSSEGAVLGESTTVAEETPNLDNNLATAIVSGWGDILSICTLIALLVLLVIYLIWRLWLRKKYERDLVGEEEIKNRFYLFFGSSSLLAILVLLVLNEYCPIPVFLIALVISICLYAYRKLI